MVQLTINNNDSISASGTDIQTLKQGLPYVFVHYVPLSKYINDAPAGTFDNASLAELSFDKIKKLVEEQKVQVLVFDFYEYVRIINYKL